MWFMEAVGSVSVCSFGGERERSQSTGNTKLRRSDQEQSHPLTNIRTERGHLVLSLRYLRD
jgi:hypothetical protein